MRQLGKNAEELGSEFDSIQVRHNIKDLQDKCIDLTEDIGKLLKSKKIKPTDRV